MPPPQEDQSHAQYHADRGNGNEYNEDEFYHGPYSLEPFDGAAEDAGEGNERASGDVMVGIAHFMVLTVFLIAFVMVLTISLTVMMHGPSADLTFSITPFFWLALSLLMFFLFYLTKDWNVRKKGDAVPSRPVPVAGADRESDVY